MNAGYTVMLFLVLILWFVQTLIKSQSRCRLLVEFESGIKIVTNNVTDGRENVCRGGL